MKFITGIYMLYINWSPLFYYFFILLDISIMATLIYYALRLFNTRTLIKITSSILAFFLILLVSQILRLQALLWVMENLLSFLPLIIIIIFQQEIKSTLIIRFGNTFINKFIKNPSKKKSLDSQVILKTLKTLSESKTGAIFIFTQTSRLDFVTTNAIPINASISTQLLVSIFNPSSPLHDGAVVIDDNKVLFASVFVPITEKITNHQLGSRHRAAIGITEKTDALAIVVSEETGFLSFCKEGQIEYNLSAQQIITNLLTSMEYAL